MPAIRRAKEMGYYVITADYLPSNPGHQISDEYHNVSTTDREAILDLAKNLEIDGIIPYASDPAAPVAAYVANKLGLPASPLKSIEILGIKHLWDEFLKENNFYTPQFQSGSSVEEFHLAEMPFPLIVKPVDSSGSKGVRRIENKKEFPSAFDYAKKYSRNGIIIVEEFIEMVGFLVAGDGFFGVDKLEYMAFGDGYVNHEINPLVPTGISFPAILDSSVKKRIIEEIERALSLLKVKNLCFNLEVMINNDGKIFLKEIGPRNGGYFTPQVIEYFSGIPIADFAIRSAMEHDFKVSEQEVEEKLTEKCYAFFVLHSGEEGKFEKVRYAFPKEIKVLEEHIFVSRGENVYRFDNSNNALGVIILEFENQKVQEGFFQNTGKYVQVILQKEWKELGVISD